MELTLRGMVSLSLVRQIVFPEQDSQRVNVRCAETQVRMPTPTFSVFEPFRQLANGQRYFVHRLQIGPHPLTDIQPFLLTAVTGQSQELHFVDRSRVHEGLRNDSLTEAVAQAVWQDRKSV